MQNRTRYDSASFLSVYSQLSNDELLPFLKSHSLELDRINDETLVCDIVAHTLKHLIKQSYLTLNNPEPLRAHNDNISTIHSLISLLRPQLISLRSFALAMKLLKTIDSLAVEYKAQFSTTNSAYPFAKLELAKTMRLAITNGTELSSILEHIDRLNKVSFIDEQEKFWAERDYIQAREDAIKAEQQAKEQARVAEENAREEARQAETKQRMTFAPTSVNTLRHAPVFFSPVSAQNDSRANVELSPVNLRHSM